jgi:hypothetical protein
MVFAMITGLWGMGVAGCKDDKCERIAEVRKKCDFKSKRRSIKELKKECMTAMRRGKKWVRHYLACIDEVEEDCKKLKVCLAREERKAKERLKGKRR